MKRRVYRELFSGYDLKVTYTEEVPELYCITQCL